MVVDLNPGPSNSVTYGYTAFGDFLVFAADHDDYGFEVWKYEASTAPLPLVVDIEIANQIKCFGDQDGALEVTVTGGVPSYSFSWDPPSAQGQSPTDLAAGVYELMVTDDTGTTLTSSIELTEPPLLTVMTSSTPEMSSAMDGTTEAAADGGTPPYNYTWDTNPPATTATVENLAAGDYMVTVTDSNGCSVEDIVTVDVIGSTENVLAAKFKISPTISTGYFSLETDQPILGMEVQLTDQSGKKVKSWSQVKSGQRLNVNDIPNAMYFLQINLANQFFVKRLIVAK